MPTTTPTEPQIVLGRLTEVSDEAIAALLNDPRNHRHMPLAGEFSVGAARGWARDKDAQWTTNGYGPWAIMIDGEFAGWGGFQREDNGADYALVLSPDHWGHGEAVTRAALRQGFGELALESVIIALPYTRNPGRVVARYGFRPDGDVSYGGSTFRQYRLSREDWAAAQG